MGQPVLSVQNLSKKFCRSLKHALWYGVKDLANELLCRHGGRSNLRKNEFWALRDVSFELHRGETLGLIGHNGAGKSTLLKLINGLVRPDVGRISVRGRVGALIELGMGFHPILTGRENIYINAAVLGLGRKEVERRMQQIIDFAEIGDFLETPVQHYSSGMKARLGFAIAAHLDPDLLLVDEVLSVGDASFRQRCVDRLADYRRQGGSIIFVSHNTTVVEQICDRVLLLDHGRIDTIGDPMEVVRKYEEQALELNRRADKRLGRNAESPTAADIRVTDLQCCDAAGNPRMAFEFGEPFEVRLRYEFGRDLPVPYFVLVIQRAESHALSSAILNMQWDDIHPATVPPRGEVSCVLRNPVFPPGLYRVYIGIQSQASTAMGEKWLMPQRELGSFTVLPRGMKERLPGLPAVYQVAYPASTIVEHSWRVNGEDWGAGPVPAGNLESVQGR